MSTRTKKILALLAALIIIGVIVTTQLPLGLRNKNPGNLRKSADKWQGLAADQGDGDFFIFTESFFGLRAMAKTLISYQARHDINTIQGVIERYAPSTENDTQAYIDAVSKRTGLDPDKRFVMEPFLPLLMPAMITQENGINPFSDAAIGRAILAAKA